MAEEITNVNLPDLQESRGLMSHEALDEDHILATNDDILSRDLQKGSVTSTNNMKYRNRNKSLNS